MPRWVSTTLTTSARRFLVKRSALVFPGIAAVVAAAIVALGGPFDVPVARAAFSAAVRSHLRHIHRLLRPLRVRLQRAQPAEHARGAPGQRVPRRPQRRVRGADDGSRSSLCAERRPTRLFPVVLALRAGQRPHQGTCDDRRGHARLQHRLVLTQGTVHQRERGLLGHQPDRDVGPQMDPGHVRERGRLDAVPIASRVGWRRSRLHVTGLPQRRRAQHRDRTRRRHAGRIEDDARRHVPLVPRPGQLDRRGRLAALTRHRHHGQSSRASSTASPTSRATRFV